MPSEIDQKILSILKSPSPERIDELMAAVGEAMSAALPLLLRKAKRYLSEPDAEDTVSNAIERALKVLSDQLHGVDTPYNYRYGEFQNWLLGFAGTPGAKRKSGAIGAEIQRQRRNNQRLRNIDDHVGSLAVEEPGGLAAEDEIKSLAKTIDENQLLRLLRPLLPRERFAVVYCYGFRNGAISVNALIDAATQLGFDTLDLSKLALKAARLLKSATLSRLTQKQVGSLLGLKDREIRYILASALTKMRKVQFA